MPPSRRVFWNALSLGLLAAVWGGVLVPLPVRAQSAWMVVKYESRDYLTMRNVADFYKLKYLVNGKNVTLQSPGCVIKGDIGSKELIINGVKFIMSSDLAEHEGNVLLSRLDLTKLVEPVLRPNRIRNVSAIRTVIIDPGHGGHDRGATSVYGDEKNFALDVGLRLRQLLLRKGLKVQMTRTDDTFVPLEQRAAFANRFRDGIFIAIHFNAGSDAGTGVETYTLAPRFVPSTGDDSPSASYLVPCAGNVMDPENMALATATHAAMLSRLPMVDRGIKRARFCVLRLCTIPGVLVEGGFVSNVQEAARIAQPAYRQAEAEAIALAVGNYMAATAVNNGPQTILADADANKQKPSLSITPGMVGMQNGVPTIGATVPSNTNTQKVEFTGGPTVEVPRSN